MDKFLNYSILLCISFQKVGFHFDLVDTNPISYAEIAIKICDIIKNPKYELDNYRETLKSSKTLITWTDVARKWLEELP